MTDAARAILCVLGALEQLTKWGYLDYRGQSPTPKGISEFDQLMAAGYVPKPVEIQASLRALNAPPSELENITTLLEAFFSRRFPEHRWQSVEE